MPPESTDRLATAGELLAPQWSALREQRVWAAVTQARARRDRVRQGALGASVVAVAVTLSLWFGMARLSPPGASAARLSRSTAPAAVASSLDSPAATDSVRVLARGLVTAGPAAPTHAPHSLLAQARQAASPSGLLLRLKDGSRVVAVEGGTVVEPLLHEDGLVRVALRSGAARFSVHHDPRRRFEVQAGAATVTVLGTEFTVRLETDVVEVAVHSGMVTVTGPGSTLRLTAGNRGSVPRAPATDVDASRDSDSRMGKSPTSSSSLEPSGEALARGSGPSEGEAATRGSANPQAGEANGGAKAKRQRTGHWFTWRELAERGDYGRAYDRMQLAGPVSVLDAPAELLLAADVARLSGHPEQAVGPLRRILAAHRKDPRAGLASFTLGRVLLDQLGQPANAARAFRKARRLAPQGALAEDALAREVESWARAGDHASARRSAREFRKTYPSSSRLAAVARWARGD